MPSLGKRTPEIVAALRRRDGDACWYCGFLLSGRISLEHLIPKARGGTEALWNLALAHPSCNFAAADKRLAEKFELRDRLRGALHLPLARRCRPAEQTIGLNARTRRRNLRYEKRRRNLTRGRTALMVPLRELANVRGCQVCGKITTATITCPFDGEAICHACCAWATHPAISAPRKAMPLGTHRSSARWRAARA